MDISHVIFSRKSIRNYTCEKISSGELKEINAINLMYSDAAIIAQNMVLRAVELGVGVCQIWGSIMAMNDEIIKKIDLHEGFVPCCSIIVGKTNEKYEIRNINEDRIAINRL